MSEERLRKIEALDAGATTAGDKSAPGAAAERIRRQFEMASKKERAAELRFSIPNPGSRQLFIALCRRYNIKPFRYTPMHRQTVMTRRNGYSKKTVLTVAEHGRNGFVAIAFADCNQDGVLPPIGTDAHLHLSSPLAIRSAHAV
jgi:hypothetical protein